MFHTQNITDVFSPPPFSVSFFDESAQMLEFETGLLGGSIPHHIAGSIRYCIKIEVSVFSAGNIIGMGRLGDGGMRLFVYQQRFTIEIVVHFVELIVGLENNYPRINVVESQRLIARICAESNTCIAF